MGYNVLDHLHLPENTNSGASQEKLGFGAKMMVAKSQDLGLYVEKKINKLQLEEDQPLGSVVCERLTKAWLVAELLLLPVRTMVQVLE